MDFMKILKSLEEALYEVMVWLVFYPLTFWRVLTQPAYMMAYAAHELGDEDEDRYSDKLSPPIFLAITLGLAHLLELGLGSSELEGFLADDRNLLAFRMVMFSTFPLVLAVRLLRKRREPLDRKALKGPFYAQCYVAAPWALVVGTVPLLAFAWGGATLDSLGAALGVIGVAAIWYLILQARWFARTLDYSFWRGFGSAVSSFLLAMVIILAFVSAVAAV
ncbi:hypothetical protein K3163_06430 [Qipengyuania sp. 1NDW9]|uniref:hypothetical protein n=1 Tax=Qipengyuania xiapuensis TaxID=2867236 RepID=UPI001C875FE1|nr:hypothetical protein [Qipengyuania xiapuensis]MBX7492839.1 hypothetical protein [Qipengyuania xiapuensis]